MSVSNDEIVSDLITLIHSSTQSSYVTCSQLTSKIFAYLSEIELKDHPWNELELAIEVTQTLFFSFHGLLFSSSSNLIKVLIIPISVTSANYCKPLVAVPMIPKREIIP